MDRRHEALDRFERRLGALGTLRAPPDAEGEALERELGDLFTQYLHRCACVWVFVWV